MIKQIHMRYPGGRKKALTLSYDDGCRQDKKMVELLDRHGIKCTFNICSGNFGEYEPEREVGCMSGKECVELYTKGGHEIAIHSLYHPRLEVLSPAAMTYQVMQDRLNLEKLVGKPVRGMAYPHGAYNSTLVDCLRACGVAYARTITGTERFELPVDWLRMPATCHHKNPRLDELCERFLTMDVKDSPKLFFLWGHSHEFSGDNNWEILEKFVEQMGGHEDIWYATNIEIYDYVQAYEHLIWSADLSYAVNPTAQNVFVLANNQTVELPAGQITSLV